MNLIHGGIVRGSRKRLALASTLVAGALLLAACGSGASAGGSGGGGGGGGGSEGVTKDTITFGMATPLAGPASSLGTDGRKGAEVFIKWLNAQGGTKGHKWNLDVQDSKFTAQGNVAAAKYLIEQKHVFADWGDVGSTALAALSTYNNAKVPYLFPYALAPQMTEPGPYVFTIVPPSDIQMKAFSNWVAQNITGTHKFGTLVLDSADGKGAASGFKSGAAGKLVVASQTYPNGTTNWEPQLIALRSAGITDLMLHGSDSWMATILQELQQLGMGKVHVYGSTGTVTPLLFKLAGKLGDGQNAVSITAPSTASSVPGIKQFLDAFAKYAPGYQPGTFALHSWVTGLIVAKAIDAIPGNITRDALVKSLESIKGFDTGGITAPLTFSATEHLGNRSVEIVKGINGQWIPQTGFLS
jgi:branched-chain amino acid transport system substrate-binding protein